VVVRDWANSNFGCNFWMAASKVYIPVAKIRAHLERVFSPAMTEKIMISLDLIFGECTYKQLLDKVQQVLLSNKQD